MNSKTFLEQWKEGRCALESLERQILFLNSSIGQLSSVPFDKDYTTGSRDIDNSSDVKKLLQRDDCQFRLNQLRRRYSTYQDQVFDSFRKMPDNEIKESLMRYYCHNETQRSIADSFGYNDRQIRRYLSYGCQAFPMPAEPVDLEL